MGKFADSCRASSLVGRLAAERRPGSSLKIEIGEQMVTTLILILGGVLLAALALIYFSLVRRRQPKK
jgi:predicted Co/Zn/Cd cation transporter (cation efflux family)